ncbi:RNA 3'-terminal phosphate cyclase [soil metagenome]
MAGSSTLINIDGSYGEGGGALLRTALVMSAMTQQAVLLENIRHGTRFHGLDVEDLVLIDALRIACQADVVGADDHSPTLTFIPKTRPHGLNQTLETLRADSGRGANALVVLNALLPVLCRTGVYSSVACEGETYGFNSLTYDYFSNVTLGALKKIGLFAVADLMNPGFGRDSDGMVRMEIEPSALSGIEWNDRGTLLSVHAVVSLAGLPGQITERAVSHLKNLSRSANLVMEIETAEFPGRKVGAFVTLWATYERGFGGGIAMGSRGVKPETLVQTAFEHLYGWMSSSATVDEHLADQILLPLAFAEGSSTFTVQKLTQRLLTAIWVIKQFTPIHITVRGSENGPGTVSIQR